MSPRKRFDDFQPNFVGAEPAAPVLDAPAPPLSEAPAARRAAGKGKHEAPAKRMRELSDYIQPFTARLRPEQAQAFADLVRDTSKSRVRLLEEALDLLLKKYRKS
jgi:hypothetical protein